MSFKIPLVGFLVLTLFSFARGQLSVDDQLLKDIDDVFSAVKDNTENLAPQVKGLTPVEYSETNHFLSLYCSHRDFKQ